MPLYLDTSAIVPLLTDEPFSARAQALLAARREEIIVSDFGAAEYSSAMARLVRIGVITPEEARLSFDSYDQWQDHAARHVGMDPADIRAATRFVRSLDFSLRAPDAIHIAIALRLGATLVTFDRQMAAAAGALGVTVADI